MMLIMASTALLYPHSSGQVQPTSAHMHAFLTTIVLASLQSTPAPQLLQVPGGGAGAEVQGCCPSHAGPAAAALRGRGWGSGGR